MTEEIDFSRVRITRYGRELVEKHEVEKKKSTKKIVVGIDIHRVIQEEEE